MLDCDGRTSKRDVVVHVDVGAEVFGSVVDHNGAPVPNAHIVAFLHKQHRRRSLSDENGRFRVTGLEPGEYFVDAYTPTQASAATHLHLERGAPVEVQLVVQATCMSGIVVDQHDAPIAGATVRATARTGYVPERIEMTTDARGRFDFGALQLAEYDLYASWPSQVRRRDAAPTVRVRGSESDLKILLESPGTVTGRVLRDGIQMSYFGASLDEGNWVPGSNSVGVSDPDGRFTIRADPGTWRLAFVGPGASLKVIADLVLERGKVVELGDIAMERGQRIVGHVRDRAGAPVAGARVKIDRGVSLYRDKSRLRQWFAGVYDAISDETGAYVLDGIWKGPSRKAALISAVHPARGASVVRHLPPGDETIDFVLLGAGTIDGVVEGTRGGYVSVEVVAADEPAGARWTSVDRSSRFRFDDVPAGDYVVALRAKDRAKSSSATVTVIANQSADVKLVMVSSSVQVTIKVPRGRGKDLVIERPGDKTGEPVSRLIGIRDDSVSFSDIEPGVYRISLDGKLWTTITVAAEPPEQSVDMLGAR